MATTSAVISNDLNKEETETLKAKTETQIAIASASKTSDPSMQVIPVQLAEALKQNLKHHLPQTLSRLPISINNIATGVMLTKIGSDAVAASALINTLQFVFIGTSRGALLSTSNVIGFYEGRQIKEKIGRALHQSFAMGGILSIPAMIIFATSDKIFVFFGTESAVAATAQSLLLPFAFSIPATYFFVSDQMFALGIGKPVISMISGILFSGLSMALGFPLAVGSPGLPRLGMAGLGWGSVFAAGTSFVLLRSFYSCAGFNQTYHISKIRLNNFFHGFSYMFKLSASKAFQVFCESGNLFTIAIVAGKLGKSVLTIQQPSILLMSAYNIILVGFSQAADSRISNIMGQIRKANSENRVEVVVILRNNLRQYSKSSLYLSLVLALVPTALCIIIPDQLTRLFLNSNDLDSSVYNASRTLLLINALGLPIDSVRNTLAFLLSGLRDIWAPPGISFGAMSILGLPLGYLLANGLGLGNPWVFIMRDIGILISTTLLARRLVYKLSDQELISVESKLDEQEKKMDAALMLSDESKNPIEVSRSPLLYQYNSRSEPASDEIIADNNPSSKRTSRSCLSSCVIL